MATSPVFEAVPRLEPVEISAANTNLRATNTGASGGTGTVVTVATGVAAGTEIRRVIVQATQTTTAGMVRLFLFNGTNYRALREIPVTAITVGASTPAFRAEVAFSDLILPSASWSLVATTHNAETFHVTAMGADLT